MPRSTTKINYYLASALGNIDKARELSRYLNDVKGWHQTYDWIAHGSLMATPDMWTEVACAEVAGVKEADILILLLPGGRGSHVELGVAIAMDIPVMIHAASNNDLLGGYGYTSVFYHLPSVLHVIGGNAEFIEAVNSLDNSLKHI
jgi:hypothetical protein